MGKRRQQQTPQSEEPQGRAAHPKTGMALRKECDQLWADIIKLRAGYRSEISGEEGRLHAHHLVGKPSNRLRYELRNGICLTQQEHLFGIHNSHDEIVRLRHYEAVLAVRGDDYRHCLTLRCEKSESIQVIYARLLRAKEELGGH